MGSEEPKTYVATVIRDDFFNDPFFKVYFIENCSENSKILKN